MDLNFDWKRHKPLCKTVQSQRTLIDTNTVSLHHKTVIPPDPVIFSKSTVPGSSDFGRNSDSVQSSPSSANQFLSLPLLVSSPKCKKLCSGKRFCEGSICTSDQVNQVIENFDSADKASRKRHQPMNSSHLHLIDHTSNPIFSITLQDHLKELAASGLVVNQQQAVTLHLKCIAEHVIECLNKYGWAVVDNFLGPNHCYHVHREMNYLYKSGIFTPGQLMESRAGSNSQKIRSDEIYWFDSKDERVSNAVTVRLLVSMIDSIIVHFNGRIPYKISGRSRAMLAVYPSNGTHYVKHVDNPVKDGRCVTSIYYCNQNWNVLKDGGCFRLSPETSCAPVDIDPRGDRLLFLWSDRRNPHEVRPVYRDRYAITIWYFDKDEKLAAMAKKREEDIANEKIKNKQQLRKTLFDSEQASMLQSSVNNFAELESDELSSHDNLPNQSNIFHPTVSSAQLP